MTESIQSIKAVYSYAKSLFDKRKDNHFEDSMKKSLFEGEETAINVFLHSVSVLYWASNTILKPEAKEDDFKLELDPASESPLYKQLSELFKKAMGSFIEARSQFNEEDLSKIFKGPFGEITYDNWFAFMVHHSIGHIYQAFRLQALYLRHKV